MNRDKQLQTVDLATVLEKRRLEQALNAKEFAVLVGISYSTARSWFRQPGFPVFCGVVFWQDFVQWRSLRNGLLATTAPDRNNCHSQKVPTNDARAKFSGRAAQILAEASSPNA